MSSCKWSVMAGYNQNRKCLIVWKKNCFCIIRWNNAFLSYWEDFSLNIYHVICCCYTDFVRLIHQTTCSSLICGARYVNSLNLYGNFIPSFREHNYAPVIFFFVSCINWNCEIPSSVSEPILNEKCNWSSFFLPFTILCVHFLSISYSFYFLGIENIICS